MLSEVCTVHAGSPPTPEVTIPEQKPTKGKGPKTGVREKRSTLLESEVGREKWGGGCAPPGALPQTPPGVWPQPCSVAVTSSWSALP